MKTILRRLKKNLVSWFERKNTCLKHITDPQTPKDLRVKFLLILMLGSSFPVAYAKMRLKFMIMPLVAKVRTKKSKLRYYVAKVFIDQILLATSPFLEEADQYGFVEYYEDYDKMETILHELICVDDDDDTEYISKRAIDRQPLHCLTGFIASVCAVERSEVRRAIEQITLQYCTSFDDERDNLTLNMVNVYTETWLQWFYEAVHSYRKRFAYEELDYHAHDAESINDQNIKIIENEGWIAYHVHEMGSTKDPNYENEELPF